MMIMMTQMGQQMRWVTHGVFCIVVHYEHTGRCSVMPTAAVLLAIRRRERKDHTARQRQQFSMLCFELVCTAPFQCQAAEPVLSAAAAAAAAAAEPTQSEDDEDEEGEDMADDGLQVRRNTSAGANAW
jgi:hypothetical protein